MRRLLLLPTCLVLVAALLSGCGGDDDAATDAGGEATSDERHAHGDDTGANSAVVDGARVVQVEATSFEFDPASITVEVGEDIAVELTASDIRHDFVIDELDAHVVADAGKTAEGGLRAEEPGSFTYYCSVAGHREAGMEGTLVVRES